MFLASLLPGIRDFRVPLAVGLTYLMTAWVLFYGRVPEEADAEGLVAAAYRLVAVIGAPASLAVLVFAAYLAGNLATFSWLREVPLSFTLKRSLDGGNWFKRSFNAVDKSTLRDMFTQIQERLSLDAFDPTYNSVAPETRLEILHKVGLTEQEGEAQPLSKRDDLIRKMTREVLNEIPTAQRRLRLSNTEAFASYDQKASEAQFRQAISFPVALLIIACFIVGPWWIIVALPAPFLLWLQGVRRAQEARSDLIQAVLQDVAASTILDFLRHVIPSRMQQHRNA